MNRWLSGLRVCVSGWLLGSMAIIGQADALSPRAASAVQAGACPEPVIHSLAPYLPADTAATSVFVVLSPRMPYALPRWPAMRATAEELGFKVTPLRDPRVAVGEWQAATDTARLPALRCVPALDFELSRQLGVLHHAPSSLVAACGQLHPWPILGVMPDAAWRQLLLQRWHWLEDNACSSKPQED